MVVEEASVAYVLAEGASENPAACQDDEAAGLVESFDDRDGEPGSEAPDPGSASRAGVAAVDPQEPQLGGPRQPTGQHGLGTSALWCDGRGEMDAQQPAQRVHQQVELALYPTAPPCGADLTLWLSRMAAMGLVRLPARPRTNARSRALSASQTCSRAHLRKTW